MYTQANVNTFIYIQCVRKISLYVYENFEMKIKFGLNIIFICNFFFLDQHLKHFFLIYIIVTKK